MSSPPPAPMPELAVSAAWHEHRLQGELRTITGEPLAVVHRGTWSHGLGPDFNDALIAFGHELRAGDIEVHVATSAWRKHGHDTDPRYNTVILHVVLQDDGAETRRQDGAVVPVLVLGPHLTAPLALDRAVIDWSRFGVAACAPELSVRQPERIRAILHDCGDRRMMAKSARIEAKFTFAPPAEALYQELWDGLGFSANRTAMHLLAQRLPLGALEGALGTVSADNRADLACGLLCGVGGFLPLSPGDALAGNFSPAATDRLEACWARHGDPWRDVVIAPSAWTRARVRPANHPVRRLAAGAALITAGQASGGLVPAVLAPLRTGTDPVRALLQLTDAGAGPLLGADRAGELVANAVIPFAFALAAHTGDDDLRAQTAQAWESLPAAAGNAVTRRALRQVTGGTALPRLGARGQQGLLHLDGAFCAPRRCYECEIARAVIADDANR